ncbi:NLP-42 protein [Aphelenchoides avenae]|nr:NLP-42 protein [Aphelenchus avenae]
MLSSVFSQYAAVRPARYARAAPEPQPAEFDDLGWAWGKRSKAAERPAQFDDLGWAWGKRSAPAQAPTNWDDLGWAWGKRKRSDAQTLDSSSQLGTAYAHPEFVRLVRSWQPMKKNPDWHDLGWTWGRRK